MSKKIITYLLLFSFLNYLGCSSTQYITVNEYEPNMLKKDPPSEIFITTNELIKYHFTNDLFYYYIKNDTLYAKHEVKEYEDKKGGQVKISKMVTIESKLSLGNIKSIEDSGPDEITVITTENKELHFVNEGYYYLENDTLYGKGEIYSQELKEDFEGRIALSIIKSVYSRLIVKGEDAEEEINFEKQNENEGAEVTVLLKDGTEKYGELLSVRDSSIIICKEYSATEEELANLTYPILTIPNGEIEKVTMEGHSYVMIGIGAGLIGGILIGFLAGGLAFEASDGGYEEATSSALIVFLAGLIAGGIIGGTSSTDEVVLKDIPHGYDYSGLKPLARYSDNEPEYLKAIK
ncbi:MAG: hypothetical protein KAQ90_03260 [Melioribacteraceae bacterium]|nr:hypothetical protein [Melioribacteraceae bacterium]